MKFRNGSAATLRFHRSYTKQSLWSTRMSGARIAVSLGFRCGECQLNNCKAQRLIVQKQVSKFKTLKIRTRPVPSPLPEANPGKVPSQHFAQISYRILRTLQSSKATLLRNFRRRDGAALGSSDPLHSEEVTMSLVQPFNHGIFGGSEHHFFAAVALPL